MRHQRWYTESEGSVGKEKKNHHQCRGCGDEMRSCPTQMIESGRERMGSKKWCRCVQNMGTCQREIGKKKRVGKSEGKRREGASQRPKSKRKKKCMRSCFSGGTNRRPREHERKGKEAIKNEGELIFNHRFVTAPQNPLPVHEACWVSTVLWERTPFCCPTTNLTQAKPTSAAASSSLPKTPHRSLRLLACVRRRDEKKGRVCNLGSHGQTERTGRCDACDAAKAKGER